jgi:hypothetical protein
MTPSKYDIADWILAGRLPKDLSKNEAWAYDMMRYPMHHERAEFTHINATVMLYVLVEKGFCPALVFDDNGHWALTMEGIQTMTDSDDPVDVNMTMHVQAAQWRDTIPDAVHAAIKDVMTDSI